MKSEKISLIIDGICKELGIDYNSKNSHYLTFLADAMKLGRIYQDLKIMIGDIKDIEMRHGFAGIKDKFEEIIKELDIIDQEVIQLSKQLRDKKDD